MENKRKITIVLVSVLLLSFSILILQNTPENDSIINGETIEEGYALYRCTDGLFTWEKVLTNPLIIQMSGIKCKIIKTS